MNQEPTLEWLSLRTLGLLLATLCGVVLPHVGHMPVWVIMLVLAAAAWRFFIAWQGYRLPSRWLLMGITLLTAAGVIITHGNLLGRDPGTSLLAAMAGLKLLEMRRKRDTQFVIYLGFFLIITHFLYTQSIPNTVYLLVAVWAMTVVMIRVHRATGGADFNVEAKRAALMVAQALPVMLLLFVLFPRIPGPLWGLPEDAHAGRTGLSDSMEPGSISNLSRSGEVAFRVTFDGPIPPDSQRYWRGPVFSSYDGLRWTQTAGLPEQAPPHEVFGPSIDYRITLQPHGRDWLFALDIPGEWPSFAAANWNMTLTRDNVIDEVMAYRVSSHPEYRLGTQISDDEKQLNRWIPPRAHPRSRELAEQWRRSSDSDRAVLRQAIEFFTSRPFSYTLQPELLTGDRVDQFLFDTREGFCEHYASAFVVLMRAAGIPARVVTGYLGGEMHPNEDYMIVRQSDAHAWSEVWLEGDGWVRIDPTGFVAPDRVELGLSGAVPEGDPIPFLARRGAGLLKRLSLRWDAIEAGWDRWVLAYGPELQRSFLGRFGLDSWQRMTMLMGGLLGLFMSVLFAWTLWHFLQRPRDPVLAAYQRFCRQWGRAGLPRAPSEGPLDYARRLKAAAPTHRQAIDEVTRLYVSMRYAEQPQTQLPALREAVDKARPPHGV